MERGFTFRKSVLINAGSAEVWSVLTDPQLIPQFYFDIHWKTDWKKGSPIVFHGVWDHEPFEDKGFIIDIEPGKFIQYSYFNPASGIPDIPENYTAIRFELEADGSQTIFTICQYGFKTEADFSTVLTKWDAVHYDVKKLAEGKS